MSNNSGTVKETPLKNVLENFVRSYAERDKSVEFSDWLAEKLRQEIPDASDGSCQKLAGEIVEGIAAYDRTLNELNNAVDAGQSKEEWLAERMAETYADMPISDAGKKLQEIESDFNTSNAQLMEENGEAVLDAEFVEWNEYSVKNKAYEIGKQAVLSGLAEAANTIKQNMANGETDYIGGIVGKALQDGLETASGEVKAAVAGAVKVAAVKKLTDMLPADTPTETICDIAGMAVENAGALLNVAVGKSTITEALDKIGKAATASACRLGGDALKGKLASIPYVGPLVVNLAGGLLDHMKSPKFAENVHAVVHDAAIATWEGMKAAGRRILDKLKNSALNSLHN